MIDPELKFLMTIREEHLLLLAVCTEYDPVDVRGKRRLSELPEGEQAIELARRRRELVERVHEIGTHAMISHIGYRAKYSKIVKDVAGELGLSMSDDEDVAGAERAIVLEVGKRLESRVTPNQRASLEEEFRRQAKIVGRGSDSVAPQLVGVAALSAAQLSGFGVYVLASSGLAAVTGAIGVTLPFAVYTGLTSAISVVIGPAGWAVLGVAILHKLGRPDSRKRLAAVLAVAALRGLNTALTQGQS